MSYNKNVRFKKNIDDSVANTYIYSFSRGSEYELGFCRHSGMVTRVQQCGITDWFMSHYDKCLGRTCVLNLTCQTLNGMTLLREKQYDKELCDNTVLKEIIERDAMYDFIKSVNDMCAYIPRVAIADFDADDISTIDIITGRLPDYTDSRYHDDTVYQEVCNKIQLGIHVAACNRVDNLIVPDYTLTFAHEDVRMIAQIFGNILPLYKNYLSNVIFLNPYYRSFDIFREELTNL